MDRWWTVVNAVMNLRVLQNAGNFFTSWETFSFSGNTLFIAVSYSSVNWV